MYGEGQDTEGQVYFPRDRKSRALQCFHLPPSCEKNKTQHRCVPRIIRFLRDYDGS